MNRGYPDRPSVLPGDTLWLHAASDTPDGGTTFFALFYRQGGDGLVYRGMSGAQTAFSCPLSPPDQDFGWPAFAFPVPDDWPSGVYIALFLEAPDGQPPDPEQVDPGDPGLARSQTLFVVRRPAGDPAACILYKVSTFTYHAYDLTGDPEADFYRNAVKLTLHRPGGGVGGHTSDDAVPDALDPSSFRQTFAHWEVPFIGWMESNGYQADYCTDLDLHRDQGDFLPAYHLLLSVGHDEYWSREMRDNVEAFVAGGGNVAFFSGNVCYWQVRLEDDDTTLVCYKHSGPDPVTDPKDPDPTFGFDPSRATVNWFEPPVNRSENSMTGVSYRDGGGWWSGVRDQVGYTVQYHDHWVFDGTGLNEGGVFGQDGSLVGYECDGAGDGTPENFLVLGVGTLDADHWRQQDLLDGRHTATMGLYTNNGTVFTAATTDWARVLAAGDAAVDQITRNVLDRLRAKAVRILGPFPTLCGDNIAVQGRPADFLVDTSGLSSQDGLHYQWSISTGADDPPDQPTFRADIPCPSGPVTVSVTVDDGTDCKAFGTLTFTPVTAEGFLLLELLCALRQLLWLADPAPGELERKHRLTDPLWDPLRDGLAHPPGARELREILRAGELVVERAKRLIDMKPGDGEI